MFEQTQNVRGSEDHKRGFMLHTSNAHIASFQNKLSIVDDISLLLADTAADWGASLLSTDTHETS